MDYLKDFDKHKDRILRTLKSPEYQEKELISDILTNLKNANTIELSHMLKSDNYKAYFLLFLAIMYAIEPHKDELHKMDLVVGNIIIERTKNVIRPIAVKRPNNFSS